MPTTFDVDAIEKHGWRQGAVLGPTLLCATRERAPSDIAITEDNWLVVTSHDCDVVNARLDKEPTVELLRAEVLPRKPDKQQVWGRNPREMELEVEDGTGGAVVLKVRVHERWTLPREVLSTEAPARLLGDKERRLIAEWLAKRYIRAAFPTAFDGRWRAKLRDWTRLLEKHSRWLQGVYLRLSTLQELAEQIPYKVHLIVAAPAAVTKKSLPGVDARTQQPFEAEDGSRGRIDVVVDDVLAIELKRALRASSEADRAVGQVFKYAASWRKGPVILLLCEAPWDFAEQPLVRRLGELHAIGRAVFVVAAGRAS